jgi:glycerate dehydrogenase
MELADKTIGIVGFGNIGSTTARIARAFGMKVLAYTSKPQTQLPEGVTKASLDELFTQSDIVTLHCSLTPDTHHLVDAARLSQMKSTAILINTGRGPLVDEPALAQALHAGSIAAAGLDVLSVEPPSADNPLLTAPNCYITPHIAWATREARSRLMCIAVENLRDFIAGRIVNSVV